VETCVRAAYRPRDAAAEDSLRSFLQCGIPRFGAARFRCKDCSDSRLVPFSCKRRMACPSCDSKRAAVESGGESSQLDSREANWEGKPEYPSEEPA